MAIGAKDRIDVLLVKKYASMKVDNPNIQSSMINPEKMYEAMNDYAQMHLAMINLRQNLKDTCIKAISQNIQYRKSRNLKKKVQGVQKETQKQDDNALVSAI
ncbi:MAG: hypothetical protein LUE64_04575 [Candidatus Gastranaerophilales bacterium]|nr:hypothetical protein [Candidatus Gastranaerophilales bacterium]